MPPKAYSEFLSGEVCNFCQTNIIDVLFGKIYKIKQRNIIVHYFCLLMASKIEQKGRDDQGILGFFPKDILKELQRGRDLECCFCKRTGATVHCISKNCDKVFHFTCGVTKGSLHQFFDQFNSYCPTHKPKQNLPSNLIRKMSRTCIICTLEIKRDNKHFFLWPTCCKPTSVIHRRCVQSMANNAGYYFKCPFCNNSKEFCAEMRRCGIYIPEQEASWESEPHAYEELLVRAGNCSIENCVCPRGRTFDRKNSEWQVELCKLCGGNGVHLRCSGKWNKKTAYKLLWYCEVCKSAFTGEQAGSATSSPARAYQNSPSQLNSDDKSMDSAIDQDRASPASTRLSSTFLKSDDSSTSSVHSSNKSCDDEDEDVIIISDEESAQVTIPDLIRNAISPHRQQPDDSDDDCQVISMIPGAEANSTPSLKRKIGTPDVPNKRFRTFWFKEAAKDLRGEGGIIPQTPSLLAAPSNVQLLSHTAMIPQLERNVQESGPHMQIALPKVFRKESTPSIATMNSESATGRQEATVHFTSRNEQALNISRKSLTSVLRQEPSIITRRELIPTVSRQEQSHQLLRQDSIDIPRQEHLIVRQESASSIVRQESVPPVEISLSKEVSISVVKPSATAEPVIQLSDEENSHPETEEILLSDDDEELVPPVNNNISSTNSQPVPTCHILKTMLETTPVISVPLLPQVANDPDILILSDDEDSGQVSSVISQKPVDPPKQLVHSPKESLQTDKDVMVSKRFVINSVVDNLLQQPSKSILQTTSVPVQHLENNSKRRLASVPPSVTLSNKISEPLVKRISNSPHLPTKSGLLATPATQPLHFAKEIEQAVNSILPRISQVSHSSTRSVKVDNADCIILDNDDDDIDDDRRIKNTNSDTSNLNVNIQGLVQPSAQTNTSLRTYEILEGDNNKQNVFSVITYEEHQLEYTFGSSADEDKNEEIVNEGEFNISKPNIDVVYNLSSDSEDEERKMNISIEESVSESVSLNPLTNIKDTNNKSEQLSKESQNIRISSRSNTKKSQESKTDNDTLSGPSTNLHTPSETKMQTRSKTKLSSTDSSVTPMSSQAVINSQLRPRVNNQKTRRSSIPKKQVVPCLFPRVCVVAKKKKKSENKSKEKKETLVKPRKKQKQKIKKRVSPSLSKQSSETRSVISDKTAASLGNKKPFKELESDKKYVDQNNKQLSNIQSRYRRNQDFDQVRSNITESEGSHEHHSKTIMIEQTSQTKDIGSHYVENFDRSIQMSKNSPRISNLSEMPQETEKLKENESRKENEIPDSYLFGEVPQETEKLKENESRKENEKNIPDSYLFGEVPQETEKLQENESQKENEENIPDSYLFGEVPQETEKLKENESRKENEENIPDSYLFRDTAIAPSSVLIGKDKTLVDNPATPLVPEILCIKLKTNDTVNMNIIGSNSNPLSESVSDRDKEAFITEFSETSDCHKSKSHNENCTVENVDNFGIINLKSSELNTSNKNYVCSFKFKETSESGGINTVSAESEVSSRRDVTRTDVFSRASVIKLANEISYDQGEEEDKKFGTGTDIQKFKSEGLNFNTLSENCISDKLLYDNVKPELNTSSKICDKSSMDYQEMRENHYKSSIKERDESNDFVKTTESITKNDEYNLETVFSEGLKNQTSRSINHQISRPGEELNDKIKVESGDQGETDCLDPQIKTKVGNDVNEDSKSNNKVDACIQIKMAETCELFLETKMKGEIVQINKISTDNSEMISKSDLSSQINNNEYNKIKEVKVVDNSDFRKKIIEKYETETNNKRKAEEEILIDRNKLISDDNIENRFKLEDNNQLVNSAGKESGMDKEETSCYFTNENSNISDEVCKSTDNYNALEKKLFNMSSTSENNNICNEIGNSDIKYTLGTSVSDIKEEKCSSSTGEFNEDLSKKSSSNLDIDHKQTEIQPDNSKFESSKCFHKESNLISTLSSNIPLNEESKSNISLLICEKLENKNYIKPTSLSSVECSNRDSIECTKASSSCGEMKYLCSSGNPEKFHSWNSFMQTLPLMTSTISPIKYKYHDHSNHLILDKILRIKSQQLEQFLGRNIKGNCVIFFDEMNKINVNLVKSHMSPQVVFYSCDIFQNLDDILKFLLVLKKSHKLPNENNWSLILMASPASFLSSHCLQMIEELCSSPLNFTFVVSTSPFQSDIVEDIEKFNANLISYAKKHKISVLDFNSLTLYH